MTSSIAPRDIITNIFLFFVGKNDIPLFSFAAYNLLCGATFSELS